MNSGLRGVPVRLMMRWSRMRAKTGTFSMSRYCGLNICWVVRPTKSLTQRVWSASTTAMPCAVR